MTKLENILNRFLQLNGFNGVDTKLSILNNEFCCWYKDTQNTTIYFNVGGIPIYLKDYFLTMV